MECKTCGKNTVVCNCSLGNWSLYIRRAMLVAREAADAYNKAVYEHPLTRLELRDRMEKLQGRVVNLQWAYFEKSGLAKAA